MFRTVLIANRGEIALRVARTCREMGIRTVAVHSTEDSDSAVARIADHSVQIGPAVSRRSYLNMAAIIETALQYEVDAIHPGYGFLSEDADFADACEANGITFIGPPGAVMNHLGDKSAARELMSDAGLPMLPGSLRPLEHVEDATKLAKDIGFPVIIKAVAGGGGRGMRIVWNPDEFPHAYQETRAAAQAVFGDGRVYVERYAESSRHVEIQVLCDGRGNAVHLGERDCSVQRRHQKLIEETPAPNAPGGLVELMGKSAVQGALAVGYVGAGTFEFLLTPDGNFAFMEVNCRIQVEHPVTEIATGVDLIAEQLRVAAGEPLTLRQEDIKPSGAAIECRINAEDPDRGFVPTSGTLDEFVPPGGPFVRVDTHAFPGFRISPQYDSLLAKLVVWAPDRPRAIARMCRALDEFRIDGYGVSTTVGFLRDVLDQPAFAEGRHDTALVGKMLSGIS